MLYSDPLNLNSSKKFTSNRPKRQQKRQRLPLTIYSVNAEINLVRAELHKVSVSSHPLLSFTDFLSPLHSAHPIQLQRQISPGLLGQMFTSSVHSHPLKSLSALPVPFPFQPFFCGEVHSHRMRSEAEDQGVR